MKFLPAVVCFFLAFNISQAANRQWIFFRDKGPGTENGILPLSRRDAAIKTLSPRALSRRSKSIPEDQVVDVQDLPIYQPYLDSLARIGITPILKLRWLNAITVALSDVQSNALRNSPWVARIAPVRTATLVDRNMEKPQEAPLPELAKALSTQVLGGIDYGSSIHQIKLSRLDSLQALGITGHDVLLGMLDVGFGWRTHDGINTANVINEYDFVQHDSSTASDSLDPPGADGHGTLTFSCISCWDPGIVIGGAFNAAFLLAKTENVASETHVEEDNFAAALEWMEGQGVDVTSSSLGYSVFDSGQTSYTYADMNGHTTIVARAMELAVKRGVCCVTAAGNEGNGPWNYIVTPGDVDTAITVGAVDSDGILARFSSRGPTSDGRIKPDICAMGVATEGADVVGNDLFIRASGTSLATPMAASCAALLLSAHPSLTNLQIRSLLRASGSQASNPDTAYGWGVANAYSAALAAGPVISNPPRVMRDSALGLPLVVCAIVANDGIRDDSVFLSYARNQETTFRSVAMDRRCRSQMFAARLDDAQTGDSIRYFVTAHTGTGQVVRTPLTGGNSVFIFIAGDTTPFRTSPLAFERACDSLFVQPLIAPTDFAINCTPNSFSQSTTVHVAISRLRRVTVDVYNILGQNVATIFNENAAGFYNVPWTAPHLPNGVYYLWLHGVGVSRVAVVRKGL